MRVISAMTGNPSEEHVKPCGSNLVKIEERLLKISLHCLIVLSKYNNNPLHSYRVIAVKS